MLKKLVALIIFTILITVSTHAYSIFLNKITIILDKGGAANISDKYILQPDENVNINSILSEMHSFGNNLALWSTKYPEIMPHIKNTSISNTVVRIERKDNLFFVTVSYIAPNIAKKIESSDNITRWQQDPTVFKYGELVDQNTTVEITIPQQATLQIVEPSASIYDRTIQVKGVKPKDIRLIYGFNLNITQKSLSAINIKASIDKLGNGNITEEYEFTLPTNKDKEFFLKSISGYGSNAAAWSLYDSNIRNHFGNKVNTVNKSATATIHGNTGYVTLKYSVKKLAKKYTTGSKTAEYWQIDEDQVKFPTESGVMVIPKNMRIEIKLPESAEIEKVIPPAQTQGNTLIWQGPVVANNILVGFSFKKVLVPGELINIHIPALNNIDLLIIAAIFVILSVIISIKRKILQKKVSKYIIEHSSIKNL